MITVAAKARISYGGHALWHASVLHYAADERHPHFVRHSAVGHSPEGAYANLKHRMERDGYLLVAPQHGVKSKAGILATSARVLRRTIEAYSGPARRIGSEEHKADQQEMNRHMSAMLGHVRLRDGTEPSELRGHP